MFQLKAFILYVFLLFLGFFHLAGSLFLVSHCDLMPQSCAITQAKIMSYYNLVPGFYYLCLFKFKFKLHPTEKFGSSCRSRLFSPTKLSFEWGVTSRRDIWAVQTDSGDLITPLDTWGTPGFPEAWVVFPKSGCVQNKYNWKKKTEKS